MGSGWGGREVQEGGDICIHMADFTVHQKLTQHCKTIILQLKINFKKYVPQRTVSRKRKKLRPLQSEEANGEHHGKHRIYSGP